MDSKVRPPEPTQSPDTYVSSTKTRSRPSRTVPIISHSNRLRSSVARLPPLRTQSSPDSSHHQLSRIDREERSNRLTCPKMTTAVLIKSIEAKFYGKETRIRTLEAEAKDKDRKIGELTRNNIRLEMEMEHLEDNQKLEIAVLRRAIAPIQIRACIERFENQLDTSSGKDVTREQKWTSIYKNNPTLTSAMTKALGESFDSVRFGKIMSKLYNDKSAHVHYFNKEKGLQAPATAMNDIEIQVMSILCKELQCFFKAHYPEGIKQKLQ